METYNNPETNLNEQEGNELPQGQVKVKVLRSKLAGKMSGILSGSGGAKCQLCTATFRDLHYIELLRSGFPNNRTVSNSREIFCSVNKDEFITLPSQKRFN